MFLSGIRDNYVICVILKLQGHSGDFGGSRLHPLDL